MNHASPRSRLGSRWNLTYNFVGLLAVGLLLGGGFYLARWLRSPSKVGLSFVVRILVGVALVFFVVLPLVSTTGIAAFALLYDQVVRQRHHGCDPAEFTPVEISVKETSTRAWVHTPPA